MSAGEPIAILSHSHPSVTKGGGEIVAYNLFLGLRELGRDAIFIAACPREKRSTLYLDGADEHVIFFDPEDYSPFYHLAAESFTRSLIEKLTAFRCGTASFHHFYHLGLNSIRRVATVGLRTFLTLHEYLAICNNYGQMVTRPDFHLCTRAHPLKCNRCFPETMPSQFEQRRDWFLDSLAGVERFISPSLFLAERFAEWGLAKDKIAVIENGLSMQGQTFGEHPPRRPARAEWVFGYFGQVSAFKGAAVLLEAATRLKARTQPPQISIRVHGNLIGLSDEVRERFHLACEAGIIDYRGPYDNADVGTLMRECDYIVVPSQWWENSPVVIQEAFAAGCPVIASGIGGMAEKVRDGETGLHVRPGSAVDLAATILAAADADTADRLRMNISPPADTLTMARGYLELFVGSPPRR